MKSKSWLWLISLLVVPALLFACAFWRIKQTALLTTFVVVCSLVPFFWRMDRASLKARDWMPMVVFASLCVAGRLLFAAFPNVKPVSALVIVAGLCFGRQSGFFTGALGMLVSNLFFGQGPWTPWQMYAFGAMGYGAGVLGEHRLGQRFGVQLCYGALASLLYGALLNTWFLVSFVPSFSTAAVLSVYGAGLWFDIPHMISTVAFLFLCLKPFQKKLLRIREKYNLNRL